MARLDYPAYFVGLFGAVKIPGAAEILAPRLKEWAYAGMLYDASRAAFSRADVGDGPVLIGLPILIGVPILISWRLRLDSRKLSAREASA
jgi:hypothetical protein